MTPTIRKALLWAGLILFGIIAGRSMRDPPKPDPLVPKLQAERDSLRLALTRWDAFARNDSVKVAGLDSTRTAVVIRRNRRNQQADSLRAEPVPHDTTALRQRADMLWKLYAACSVSEDSALAIAERYRFAHREAVEQGSALYKDAVKSAGMYNQAIQRIDQLSHRSNSPWRLRPTVGVVGGFDAKGPWYGPGAALGATLRVRLPLVGLPLGATVGGVAGVDLLGRPRVGVGAGLGISF